MFCDKKAINHYQYKLVPQYVFTPLGYMGWTIYQMWTDSTIHAHVFPMHDIFYWFGMLEKLAAKERLIIYGTESQESKNHDISVKNHLVIAYFQNEQITHIAKTVG